MAALQHAASSSRVAADAPIGHVLRPQIPNWDAGDTCNSPGNAMHMLAQRKKKRKQQSIPAAACAWLVEHQIGIALTFVASLVLAHKFVDSARPLTSGYLHLSYYDAATQKYGRGLQDFKFVTLWIFIFTGLRDATMRHVLLPFAAWQGLDSMKKRVRFAEQGWLFLYYTTFWSLGLYIILQTPYWRDLSQLWTNFPETKLDGLFKWYYLVQFAFWLQQIVVVNIEERRKDHWQMFTHHIVTSALILFSYGFYQTKAGNVILVLMDLSDITLPAAKMLKYAGYQTVCDIAFGVFILSWFVSRHVGYLAVCWSIYYDSPRVMTYGCYSSTDGTMVSPSTLATIPKSQQEGVLVNVMQPYTNPGAPVCYNSSMQGAFLTLLLALQCLTVMWFAMILRVAYRVISGKGADDSRSDDEDEGDEYEEAGEDEVHLKDGQAVPAGSGQGLRPLEMEVGVEGLNLKNRIAPASNARLRRGASGRSEARTGANGLSVVGHGHLGDRKELLGRIGCDKPT